jgi:methylenetetrahydrofolate reductase (NADPH)
VSVDNVKSLAADALKDGRVSAVSITDNPGGNPSLGPDALGREILDTGMDVIVHFACRDVNRAGAQSRALQLSRMGLTNILGLTGDYVGKGFAGESAPVFDLDSVTLICLLTMVGRQIGGGYAETFYTGCAVSPFKQSEAECFLQYAKLFRKASSGAKFIITQLGYDARKFHELQQVLRDMHIGLPVLGSVYHLSAGFARGMHAGRVPGAVVTDKLFETITRENADKAKGRAAAIERSARLAAVLKGLGYKGIHIGGVHRNFQAVAKILDRLEQIEDRWQEFVPDFDFPQDNGFYLYERDPETGLCSDRLAERTARAPLGGRVLYRAMKLAHHLFFRRDGSLGPVLSGLASWAGRSRPVRYLVTKGEDTVKSLLLNCQKCGDCAIQHVGFLCPESQCPKHLRNGPCGGSHNRRCEVHPEKDCVWVRGYDRLAGDGETIEIVKSCIPPRMQSLSGTSSWLNFHQGLDHHGALCDLSEICSNLGCPGHEGRQFTADKLFGKDAQKPRRRHPVQGPAGDG